MKRFLAVLLVAVMLLSVLPATSMAASYATVVGGWLRLRSAPNFSASTITSYYTGTQVEILGSSGGWYKVQTPDGRTGYMYGNYLAHGRFRSQRGNRLCHQLQRLRCAPAHRPRHGLPHHPHLCGGHAGNGAGARDLLVRISIGGTVGYMMSQFLHFGSDYPDDSNVLCYATIWEQQRLWRAPAHRPQQELFQDRRLQRGHQGGRAAEGCRLGSHPRGQPCGLG